MQKDHAVKDEFENTGRVWFRNVMSQDDLRRLDGAVRPGAGAGERVSKSEIFADCGSLMSAIRMLEPDAKPVRAVIFNKSDTTNWGVPWHQDRVIAVADRYDAPGYLNWTRKSGIWHCEPPEAVLDQMLFVRVHLDDATPANGAMEIAVGSHAAGVVASQMADAVAQQYPIESCDAERGDVLVLKMLTLHRSGPSRVHADRRAFRIDFSAADLPAPLGWA